MTFVGLTIQTIKVSRRRTMLGSLLTSFDLLYQILENRLSFIYSTSCNYQPEAPFTEAVSNMANSVSTTKGYRRADSILNHDSEPTTLVRPAYRNLGI